MDVAKKFYGCTGWVKTAMAFVDKVCIVDGRFRLCDAGPEARGRTEFARPSKRVALAHGEFCPVRKVETTAAGKFGSLHDVVGVNDAGLTASRSPSGDLCRGSAAQFPEGVPGFTVRHLISPERGEDGSTGWRRRYPNRGGAGGPKESRAQEQEPRRKPLGAEACASPAAGKSEARRSRFRNRRAHRITGGFGEASAGASANGDETPADC